MNRRLCAPSLLAAALVCCSSPPAREELIDERAAAPAREECADSLGAAAIRRIAPAPDQRRFLCRIYAIENSVTQRPLVPDNDVTLLVDGPATHAAQLAAIQRARHHVHLNAYIFNDDETGRQYFDAFVRASHSVKTYEQ